MEITFGGFLKQKRLEKKLTQKQLAIILFVSESAVSKWEKDVAHPDITLLPKLSEILGVSEHELITASIDNHSREEKVLAKKWRTLSFSWSLFFYISYGIALLVCFICDLAINKSLTWFWIVLCALLLSFCFTNLPKIIKKHHLIILPLSMYISLCLLLGVTSIYTKGNWFLVAAFSIFFGSIVIFAPIYISKYRMFSKIKKYNDFVSIFIDFIFIVVLLFIIDVFTVTNGYSHIHWYFNFALPITTVIYLILNLFLCVKFLKVNGLLKTSVILFLINIFIYILPLFIKNNNPLIQQEIDDLNIFKSDFSNWQVDMFLENNINCIIFLTILVLAINFLIFGIIRYCKNKKENIVK